MRRLRTGNDLHRALQRSEFRVEYQPVVSLAAGRVVGFEALARWEHPDRGMITPGDFIDLAEETGLIVPIGSADHAPGLRARGPVAAAGVPGGGGRSIQVSVNLSARQLGTPGLVGAVAAAIEETGIEPDCVWLEITESALMTDAKAASVALRALRGIGVHLTVDDFGTGYSSLTYLQRFPVEGLKIDRSFVDGLGHRGQRHHHRRHAHPARALARAHGGGRGPRDAAAAAAPAPARLRQRPGLPVQQADARPRRWTCELPQLARGPAARHLLAAVRGPDRGERPP